MCAISGLVWCMNHVYIIYFNCNPPTTLYSNLMFGQKQVSLHLPTLKTVKVSNACHFRYLTFSSWHDSRFCGGFPTSWEAEALPNCWNSQLVCMRHLDILYPQGLQSDGCPQITSQEAHPNGILMQCLSYLTWLLQQWSSSLLWVLEVLIHNYNDPSYCALF